MSNPSPNVGQTVTFTIQLANNGLNAAPACPSEDAKSWPATAIFPYHRRRRAFGQRYYLEQPDHSGKHYAILYV
ncbi:MAG: hypothetical protein IPL49_17235 [Saprospirales bacterium]|nr:hypothetical protein [Saprospirales bacterium]